jgi:Uncharacterized membrane protein, required for colicin V production
MEISITGWHLDVIVMIILLVSLVIGYKKGFINRVIRFISFLAVILIAAKIHGAFTFVFSAVKLPVNNNLITPILLPVFHKLLAFIIVFIVLMILRGVALLMTLKLVDFITKKLGLIGWLNSLLGAVFNALSSCLSIYLVFLMMTLPIFSNGTVILNDSLSGKFIMQIAPTVSREALEINNHVQGLFTNQDSLTKEEKVQLGLSLIRIADNTGVLTDEMIVSYFNQYQNDLKQIGPISVSQSEHNQLQKILNNREIDQGIKNSILEKLEVR